MPSPTDTAIQYIDSMLRTLEGVDQSTRANPAQNATDAELNQTDRELAGRLMRVNHCGEVCAQALYLGQGLTSTDDQTRRAMQESAKEETDHLAWCEQRLEELDTRKSILNPAFYALSFAGGALSGLLGNKFNLGFVAATEEQVVNHLSSHLEQLPAADQRSRAILQQMRQDEDQHRTAALQRGGTDFPKPVKNLMTGLSKFMTRTTYWV